MIYAILALFFIGCNACGDKKSDTGQSAAEESAKSDSAEQSAE